MFSAFLKHLLHRSEVFLLRGRLESWKRTLNDHLLWIVDYLGFFALQVVILQQSRAAYTKPTMLAL
jgi:hypothetical protein